MNLKEAIDIKNSIDKSNKQIEDIIYKMLEEALVDTGYNNSECVREQFVLWENLSSDEFTFIFPFGNIAFDILVKMNNRFKKEGFKLTAIFEHFLQGKKGLEICFVKEE